jgi:hypothetical protein
MVAARKEIVVMATVKGGKVYFDGIEYIETTILVKGPLKPGSHDLGKIRVAALGNLPIAVSVGKSGKVNRITITWPKNVKPEVLHRKTHGVARRKAEAPVEVESEETAHEHCELHRLPIIVGNKRVGWKYFWAKIIVIHPW